MARYLPHRIKLPRIYVGEGDELVKTGQGATIALELDSVLRKNLRNDRQRKMIESYYGLRYEPKNQRQVGAQFGVGGNRARQIILDGLIRITLNNNLSNELRLLIDKRY